MKQIQDYNSGVMRWRNLPFKTLESPPPDVAYLIIIEVDSPHHAHSSETRGVEPGDVILGEIENNWKQG